MTSIGEYAFAGCTGLTSIDIPNSVTSIANSVFKGCNNLTTIKVEKLNSIYDSREDCNGIIETASNTLYVGCKKTVIPNTVTSIGGWAFYGCDSLMSIKIPNSVESIGLFTFADCSGLTSVTIPNSVTSIGTGAFSSCTSLTSVAIGNFVKSIGEKAFYKCGQLQTLTVYMDSPVPVAENTFEKVDKSTCVLYVPEGSLEAYKAAPVWKNFQNIKEMSGRETAAKSALADSGIKVFGKGMNIIVKGASESAPVKVSGTNGVTLRNATGNGTIMMDTKGIYIVTVGDQTFKVWL